VASLFLLSFSSATHDIACDGFYLLVQTPHDQAAYVGVRNTAYRIAMIFSQGVLVMLAGYLEKTTGNKPFSWMIVFGMLAVLFLVLYIYHLFLLPKSEPKKEIVKTSKELMKEFGDTFVAFFKKKQLLAAIFFMLIYRFGEAQITAMGKLFMMDKISAGGLGLSTSEIGFLYGTVAVVFLLLGGILGGVLIARKGLKFWLWPMALAINIPHLTYVYLSQAYPHSLDVISICVAIEQFGYGFGFSAYLVFLMFFSEGSYKTAHYAICTAFMALGMNIPTLLSGYLQKCLGYPNFFLWIMACMVLTFIAVALIKVDKDYAKKASD
jgi:PAT family beta-lactamase induction signal transducer AmpG